VLVVDDEAAVRQTVSRMLERIGLDVLAVDGGHAALAAVGERGDALRAVVLDLTMPDMHGLDVLRGIRARAPRLPVIVVSGYARQDAIREFGDGGPQAFLQKPFTPGQLADLLRALLAPGPGAPGSPAPPGDAAGQA
jgi:CheY-like chemotaxis protein